MEFIVHQMLKFIFTLVSWYMQAGAIGFGGPRPELWGGELGNAAQYDGAGHGRAEGPKCAGCDCKGGAFLGPIDPALLGRV